MTKYQVGRRNYAFQRLIAQPTLHLSANHVFSPEFIQISQDFDEASLFKFKTALVFFEKEKKNKTDLLCKYVNEYVCALVCACFMTLRECVRTSLLVTSTFHPPFYCRANWLNRILICSTSLVALLTFVKLKFAIWRQSFAYSCIHFLEICLKRSKKLKLWMVKTIKFSTRWRKSWGTW